MVKQSYDAQCEQIMKDLEDMHDRAMKFRLQPWELKVELEKYVVRAGYTRCMQQYARGYYAAMVRDR